MTTTIGRLAGGVVAGVLCLGPLVASPASGAQPAQAVPFASADFHGYATGTEVHLAAVTAGATTLASLDQAFSGASTSSAGLGPAITSETGNVVQPSEPTSPRVNSYGRGDGLEVGAGTTSGGGVDPNQLALTGLAESSAAPNAPAVEKRIAIPAAPAVTANALDGRAASSWYPTTCPIGQPLAFGAGSAAGVAALDTSGTANPVLDTAGTGTAAAESDSYEYLSPNGDGSYGLSGVARETVAPLTVNILNVLTLEVTIAGKDPNQPITLTSRTTGESSGAAVTLGNAGLLTVTLTPAGGTPVTVETVDLSNPQTLGADGFLHIALTTATLGSDLGSLSTALSAVLSGNQVTGPLAPLFGPGGPLNGVVTTAGNTASSVVSRLANVSLGSIDIDAEPHAIGGSYSSPPTVVGGTQAAGAIDLAKVNIGVSGSALGIAVPGQPGAVDVANLDVGHLETSAALTTPIDCGVPVIKTANPTSVTAGRSFAYDISVPDPVGSPAIACDLTDMTVTDTIGDSEGTPTFEVVSANPGGAVTQTSPRSATVKWTGLSWTSGSPPLALDISIDTPTDSPAGVIQDTVVAQAVTSSCSGGASGIAGLGAGASLTGTYTLHQPSVTAPALGSSSAIPAAPAPPTTTVPVLAGSAPAKTLPFTGAIGGLWQPFVGLGALGGGGAGLLLARRARRLG